ncbi:MAG: hypothetical protein PSN34_03880 [Urechidicola sp.]|nr:hypothetical protein [Urechidicola sp.]
MKSHYLKLNLVALLTIFLFVSCETTDEIIEEQSAALTSDDITAVEEVDMVMEEITNTAEQAFVEEENGDLFTRSSSSSFFPDCLTKTVVTTNLTKHVTLDFGDGCEVRGHFMAGIMILSYEKDPALHTRTITVEFDSFRIDHKLIEGSHSILRQRENENGNPQSTATFDVNVTWDNGDTASRTGEKVREWIEGVGTGVWSDNVYLITGHWNTVRRNGDVISGEVTTALRRELVCRFLVSGVIDLTKNDRSGSLDFGDGTCDNEALLTLDDGTEIVITLH